VPGSFRAGYVLVVRELRRLLHDPAALLAIIVAPFLLAVITSYSLGARPKIEAAVGIAGVPQAAVDQAVDQFGASMQSGTFSFRVIQPGDTERLVRKGELTAAIVVPTSTSEPVRVIGARNEKIAGEVATSIAHTVAAFRSGENAAPLDIQSATAGREPLEGAEIYGPVIAVFFVLFGVGSVSRSLQAQRLDGTLSRLLVSPIRPSVVLASKGVMMFIVGVVEIGIVYATTTLWFGADWGNPLAVALVALVVVMSGIAIATAIASFASSPAAAQGLELAVALILIGIGGHMVPLRNLPDAARTVSHFTPNGAALDAFANVATDVGSVRSQLAPILIAVVFTIVVGFLAVRRITRVLPT
jgi:ABC-2 type transport system permease protein